MAGCVQSGCPFNTGGDCLEGNEPAEKCPHYRADLEPVAAQAQGGAPVGALAVDSKWSGTIFHTGEKLTAADAGRVMEGEGGTVVLCAGAADCGKTTFLARIGEMFASGQFVDWAFAGSLTLAAFERASWRATVLSRHTKPTTLRTHRRENDTFMQIRALDVGSRRSRNLLISDLAGESFPEFISSKLSCDGFAALQRADHLALFVSGKAIASPSSRHAEADNVTEFLNMVVASRGSCAGCHLQIVFSRWDMVEASEKRADLETYCADLEASISESFSERFRSVAFFRTSARPEASFVATDGEIQKIFSFWTSRHERSSRPFNVPISNRPARLFNAVRFS